MTSGVDLGLLQFNTYDEYIRSFTNLEDYRYFPDMKSLKHFLKIGYRSTSKIYDVDEFLKMKVKIADFLNPKISSRVLYGNYMKGNDAALLALAEREEPNLNKKLSTIIFLQVRMVSGFDISGYIDYEKSLRDCSLKVPDYTNWRAVFEGRKLLRPKPTDLSFFDWHKGTVCTTNTESWEAIPGSLNLVFKHMIDHRLVPVTNKAPRFKENVSRIMIQSQLYGTMILYDHVIR